MSIPPREELDTLLRVVRRRSLDHVDPALAHQKVWLAGFVGLVASGSAALLLTDTLPQPAAATLQALGQLALAGTSVVATFRIQVLTAAVVALMDDRRDLVRFALDAVDVPDPDAVPSQPETRDQAERRLAARVNPPTDRAREVIPKIEQILKERHQRRLSKKIVADLAGIDRGTLNVWIRERWLDWPDDLR